MRAIIIEDKDGAALVESLELSKLRQHQRAPASADRQEITEMHREFHYRVVTWLQSHGWKVNP